MTMRNVESVIYTRYEPGQWFVAVVGRSVSGPHTTQEAPAALRRHWDRWSTQPESGRAELGDGRWHAIAAVDAWGDLVALGTADVREEVGEDRLADDVGRLA